MSPIAVVRLSRGRHLPSWDEGDIHRPRVLRGLLRGLASHLVYGVTLEGVRRML